MFIYKHKYKDTIVNLNFRLYKFDMTGNFSANVFSKLKYLAVLNPCNFVTYLLCQVSEP